MERSGFATRNLIVSHYRNRLIRHQRSMEGARVQSGCAALGLGRGREARFVPRLIVLPIDISDQRHCVTCVRMRHSSHCTVTTQNGRFWCYDTALLPTPTA